MAREFSNIELVTIAIYVLGGERQPVDTEDIAVKSNELAPGRFVWRKYHDQISFENVRKRLSDAMKLEKGGYIVGSVKDGWLLTEKGLDFSVRFGEELDPKSLSRIPLSVKEKVQLRKERARMLASEAFEEFQQGGGAAVTTQQAEAFFRVDDYVFGKARKRKIHRILNTFRDDKELGAAVRHFATKIGMK